MRNKLKREEFDSLGKHFNELAKANDRYSNIFLMGSLIITIPVIVFLFFGFFDLLPLIIPFWLISFWFKFENYRLKKKLFLYQKTNDDTVFFKGKSINIHIKRIFTNLYILSPILAIFLINMDLVDLIKGNHSDFYAVFLGSFLIMIVIVLQFKNLRKVPAHCYYILLALWASFLLLDFILVESHLRSILFSFFYGVLIIASICITHTLDFEYLWDD